MNFSGSEHHNLDSMWHVRCFDVAKFITLIPLSLLMSCKLSFPIVGWETPNFLATELKFRKRISTFLRLLEYALEHLVKADFCIITLILSWRMRIKDDNTSPTAS